MTFPLLDAIAAGPWLTLGSALAVGVAFGWCLEQAGLGSAPKLAGQFYLRDFTVFKVMFSAIVTAMLGVWWAARLGLLDASRLYVPETFLWPQLAGGLLFGAGFVVAGLCPGTSCVAAASGRADGALTAAGFFLGVVGAGLSFEWIRPLYESGARGVLLLPAAIHLPPAVTMLAVTLTAVGGFAVASRVEGRRSFDSRGRALGAAAAAVAVIAVLAGSTQASRAANDSTPRSQAGQAGDGRRQAPVIAPLDLAARLRARTPHLRVLDLRTREEFDEAHVAAAEQCAPGGLASISIDAAGTLVLYASNEHTANDARTALLARGARDVRILARGFEGWVEDVLTPVLPSDASPLERQSFAATAQLSRYFGGTPRIVPAGQAWDRSRASARPEERSANDPPQSAAVLRRWRRGC